MKDLKYINFTDTDIESILENFKIVKDTICDNNFLNYLNIYHINDIKNHDFNKEEIIELCDYIIDFIYQKKNKLRVKDSLKLNKEVLRKSIFNNKVISSDILYWIKIIFDYNFSKYDIYDDIDNMEENYKSMYISYLNEYDANKNNNDDDTGF